MWLLCTLNKIINFSKYYVKIITYCIVVNLGRIYGDAFSRLYSIMVVKGTLPGRPNGDSEKKSKEHN